MNRISSRLLAIASLVVTGTLVLGGCGPQDLNDPDYLAQMRDAGVDSAEMQMDDKGQNVMMQDQSQPVMQEATPVAVEAAPVAVEAVPVVEPVPVPIPVVELPPQFVREPDLVNPMPTTVVNTGEQRNFSQLVEHYREIWQPQENVRVHNINNTLGVHHRYRQRVINAPVARTVVTTTGNTVFTQELLPTEVVSLPVVDYGPVFAGGCGGFGGWGGGGYCAAPFYGRGAYFGCSRPLF